MPETTVIIRTRNEEKWIGAVLHKLTEQDSRDFEIIIVDNASSDHTLEIAKQFQVKIVHIPKDDFSYPYALNLGAEHSSPDTKYLAILSAHSIPYSDHWLYRSLENFADPKVAGVYGPQLPLPRATFWDQLFLQLFYWRFKLKGKRALISKPAMGVLGFTNAIIRKDLWDKHKFDETYAHGGEDGEWAGYWIDKGYYMIKDVACTVRHSHGLDLKNWKAQLQYWSSLGKPGSFKRLPYRKDGPHLD